MTAAELSRIVEAMTRRPWFHDSESPTSGFKYVHVGDDRGPGQTVAQWLLPPDATAIAALANHANALVALVEACEAVECGRETWDIVRKALAAIHATKGTP